jgi:hypothetical protein
LGVANPERQKVLAQLVVSDKLTKETKARGSATRRGRGDGAGGDCSETIRDFPLEFLIAMMEAMTQATIGLIAAHPSNAAPSQAGRLAVVAGTGGIGYETALVLTQHGAEVILDGAMNGKPARQFTRYLRSMQERGFDLSCWI